MEVVAKISISPENRSCFKCRQKNGRRSLVLRQPLVFRLGGGLLLDGVNADPFPVAAPTFEFHSTCTDRIQGIITTLFHVYSRVDSGAALADKNCSGGHFLTLEAFDTQSFRVAISAVSGTSDPFFMCHEIPPCF